MPNVSFLSNRVRSPLLNQLAGYWTLNESSGTRYDSSRNHNNLADNNSVGSTPGVVNLAATFVAASSQSLTVTSNPSIQVGDDDFCVCGWAYLTTSTAGSFFGKYNTTDNRQFLVDYNFTLNRFRFTVSALGGVITTTVVADNFGAPSTGVWYFVCAWHDKNSDTINIQINNGVPNSASFSGGVFPTGNGAFSIGSNNGTGGFLNGRADEVGFWKRLLTPAERTYLYNSGAGRTYPFNGT